jgi:hypothetical protein
VALNEAEKQGRDRLNESRSGIPYFAEQQSTTFFSVFPVADFLF